MVVLRDTGGNNPRSHPDAICMLTRLIGDPTGGAPPNWTVEATEAAMQRLGVKTTIFSISTPGATIYEGQASYNLARQLNEYSASIRDAQPSKFGFFANLPSILDTNATLDEITHSLDILHADGVALFTRYGKGYTYLGHPSIEPVWAELNRRRAVVFIHPTDLVEPTLISPRMVQPFIDYPHETARTAVDMMTSGMRLKYPNCSVILSHAGGTLPSLVPRILGGSSPEDLAQSPNSTAALLWKAFQSFHFDIANAVSHPNLRLLLKLIPHDHLTYGVSEFVFALV